MAARNTHTCAELQYSRKTLGLIVNTTPHFCCVESVPLNEICLKCMRLASAVRFARHALSNETQLFYRL